MHKLSPYPIHHQPSQFNHNKFNIDLIVFDCDGVLIDSEIICSQVTYQELLRLGHSITLEEYMNVGTGRKKEEEESLLNQMGIRLPSHFWNTVNAKIMQTFPTRLQPIKGVKEALKSLNINMCIASNSSQSRLDLTLSLTQLKPYFERRIFDGSMVKNGKPDPDIFLLAANSLGIPPERCLVIEDSLPGIQAGQDAGMHVWGFVGGKHCFPSYINKVKGAGPDLVFNDMSRLPTLIQTHCFH